MFDLPTSRRLPVSIVLAAALTVTGCSGSKSADTAASAAPVSSDAAGAAPAGAVSAATADAALQTGSGVDAYDPCTKLTAADVQPLYSAPITMTKETDLTMFLRGCFFATAEHHSQLQVIVTTMPSLAQGNWSFHQTKDGVATKPVSGVGDKAVRDPGDVSVYALKGTVYCAADDSSQSRRELRGAESYDGKPIPDAVAEPIAAKIGALCQKIFGN